MKAFSVTNIQSREYDIEWLCGEYFIAYPPKRNIDVVYPDGTKKILDEEVA